MELNAYQIESDVRNILSSKKQDTDLVYDNRKILYYKEIKQVVRANDRLPSITFHRCIFVDPLLITAHNNFYTIKFISCIFEGDLKLHTSSNELLFEEENHFKGNLILIASRMPFTLKNCTIEKAFCLKGQFSKPVILENINRPVDVNKQGTALIFEDTKINLLQLSNSYFNRIILRDSVSFFSPCRLIDLYATEFSLEDVYIDFSFIFEGGAIEYVTISNVRGGERKFSFLESFKAFYISIELSSIDKVSIINSEISHLTLSGHNVLDYSLEVQFSKIENLTFDQIHNKGILAFREVVVPKGGKIEMNSSNLGKSDFILCDFSKATLEFLNSKVADLFLSETDFPRIVITNKEINHAQAQLAFGQLHTAFERQGDSIRSLEYHSREIEAHYNSLKNWVFPSFPFLGFTKINLWMNKWSNNFGRYWMRGIIFSFLVGLLCFYLLIISTKEYRPGLGIYISHEIVASYFKFMNPLRFFDTESLFKLNNGLPYATLTTSSFIFDFFGRILVAYGFYQTIQAFRRYGRK